MKRPFRAHRPDSRNERKRIRRAEVAHHEAGHAVIDYLLGHEIESISVAREKRSGLALNAKETRANRLLHRCLEDRDLNDQEEEEVLVLLIGYWAGPAAQMKYRPKGRYGTDFSRDRADIKEMLDFPCDMFKRDEQKMIIEIKEIASKIMDDPVIWKAVVEVAAALIERDALSGAEFLEIIRSRTGLEPLRAKYREELCESTRLASEEAKRCSAERRLRARPLTEL